MPAFLTAAKAFFTWCKGHLVTVGFAIIAVIGFLLGFEVKKKPVVIQGVDPVKTKAEQQTAVEDAQAQQTADAQIQAAEDTEVSDQKLVVAQEQAVTTKVEGNVDQTNAYLKEVSNEIGGTSSIPITVDPPTGGMK